MYEECDQEPKRQESDWKTLKAFGFEPKRNNGGFNRSSLSGLEKYKIYVHDWDQDDVTGRK